MKTFYKYNVRDYASGLDEFGDSLFCSTSRLELDKYNLVKESDKTWCVVAEWDNKNSYKKYIRKSSRKKFAYPTMEEAAIGFLAKKNRQIKILKGQLKHSEESKRLIEDEINKLKIKIS